MTLVVPKAAKAPNFSPCGMLLMQPPRKEALAFSPRKCQTGSVEKNRRGIFKHHRFEERSKWPALRTFMPEPVSLRDRFTDRRPVGSTRAHRGGSSCRAVLCSAHRTERTAAHGRCQFRRTSE